MNCFTGLALMRNAPFDQPKTNNMEPLNFEKKQNEQGREILFKELFLINNKLGNLTKLRSDYTYEINNVIMRIDRLMEDILDKATS